MKGFNGNIKNLKVRKKLNLLTGVMFFGILILGVVTLYMVNYLNNQVKEITNNWVPALNTIREMDTLTSNYRMKQFGHLSATEADTRAMYEKEMKEIAEQISEKGATYDEGIINDDDKNMYQQASDFWDEYKIEGEEIIQLSNTGMLAEANQIMVNEARTIYDSFQKNFDDLIEYNTKGTKKAEEKVAVAFLITVGTVIAMIVFITIASGIISKKIEKSITNPLARIKNVMNGIARQGDLNMKIEYESSDEFGDLASDVNHFISTLVDIIHDESYLMKEMADGNFTVKSDLRELYVGGFAQLLESMRGIKYKLGDALGGISESTSQVKVAADELANSSQNLAEGATTQASSVEEVFAMIEDVQNKAVVSSKQAHSASIRAEEVKTETENGNKQMQEMIIEMQMINKTSKEIAGIIEAIEGIASQTNLLALNASIEAARAGEAGRGFSVVADSIGKLAHQCSESANSTRQLIETAILQADKGNNIAQSTASALKIVSEGIIEVVDITENVQINCENQKESLQQVEQAMNSVSGVVETNSALAEESSSTSQELAAHAEMLYELISEFKYEEK